VLCLILLVGLGAQLYAMVLAPRTASPLGASLHDLILIVCDRVILAGLFAEEGNSHVFVLGLPEASLIAGGICLLSLPVAIFAALRAPWELRVFALTAGGIAAAGLAFPLVSANGHQWDIIAYSNSAERYFLMAQVAWLAMLLWTASRLPRPALRAGGWALTAVAFASGLVAAWAYPAFPNDNWPRAAHAILTAPPGTELSLPIPPYPPWAVNVTVR
jgi:hypothetical protein